MASKLSAFFAENAIKIENKKVVVSNRFRDEDGQPVEWEIKALTTDENEECQRKAMVNIPDAVRRGQYTRELDSIKYQSALNTAAVVWPDLNNAELQDKYGVKTPEALLKKMLYAEETAELTKEILSFSKIETLEDKVQEAKN